MSDTEKMHATEAELRHAQAQAIEDALIDFGRQSVFLTTAQETMASFLRARVEDLRSE